MGTFITSLNSKSYWQCKLSVGYQKHIRLSKHLSTYEEYCGFPATCHTHSLSLLYRVLLICVQNSTITLHNLVCLYINNNDKNNNNHRMSICIGASMGSIGAFIA